MNIVYVKIKNRDEIIFPESCYQQLNNFIIIKTVDGFHEIGAFNLNIVEYVYSDYKERKVNKCGWCDEIRSGISEE